MIIDFRISESRLANIENKDFIKSNIIENFISYNYFSKHRHETSIIDYRIIDRILFTETLNARYCEKSSIISMI